MVTLCLIVFGFSCGTPQVAVQSMIDVNIEPTAINTAVPNDACLWFGDSREAFFENCFMHTLSMAMLLRCAHLAGICDSTSRLLWTY